MPYENYLGIPQHILKKVLAMYLSTPLLQLQMDCSLCERNGCLGLISYICNARLSA
jgi:hypothetical protein